MADIDEARAGKRLFVLRINSFAAVVVLLVQFCLGIAVNLYVTIPASDSGKSEFAAFGKSVSGGPVLLILHALLGTIIIFGAIGGVIRAAQTHRKGLITLAVVSLLAVLAAWGSGAHFVGAGNDSASFSMAIATAIAIFCNAMILFVTGNAKPATV